MNTLYFEKIASHDRVAEPVTVSIPFRPGFFLVADRLRILKGNDILPTQTRVLGTWPDGSVKWLLVHFQIDLPGNRSLEVTFEKGAAPEPALRLQVEEHSDHFEIDTTTLQFLLPKRGFFPVCNVRLHGEKIGGKENFSGFFLHMGRHRLNTQEAEVEVKVVEQGPLRTEILITGCYGSGGEKSQLGFSSRVVAFAGKSYIQVDHQLIHRESEEKLELKEWTLGIAAEGVPWRGALGLGHYLTHIRTTNDAPLHQVIDETIILNDAAEHFIESFYGDFWADWNGPSGGLTLTSFQAHQNFPKSLKVSSNSLELGFQPPDRPPTVFYQGMAKTHRFQLHFHEPGVDIDTLSRRSLQYQMPDRPSLPRAWYRDHNPWMAELVPEKFNARLLTILTLLHDSAPKALGMLHFGDAPDAFYTNQGRGGGRSIWVNNEYDRPHAAALFYALSGYRRALDSCIAAAQHTVDVDLCHFSSNPFAIGGVPIHTVDHVLPRDTNPCHEWIEGLLDYYHLTGRNEALEAATSIAENVLHIIQDRPDLQIMDASAVRVFGWALRTLTAMAQETNEARWREAAGKLANRLFEWCREEGNFLSPYTSHSMPRAGFMTGLTINSLAYYAKFFDDKRIRSVVILVADDLLKNGMGPDGLFYYKEFPSLNIPLPNPHVIETIIHAYLLTGDRRYLRVATKQFSAAIRPFDAMPYGQGDPRRYTDDPGAVVIGKGGARVFADNYVPFVIYGGVATREGALDWLDYADIPL